MQERHLRPALDVGVRHLVQTVGIRIKAFERAAGLVRQNPDGRRLMVVARDLLQENDGAFNLNPLVLRHRRAPIA
jgi:hypothetical protein